VNGQVQGVGFRWYVQREADHLGLAGWVANHMDGSVEVVAEGPRDALEHLSRALWQGPAGASVRDVATTYEPARGNILGFTIRSGEHRGD
jgi:acylphosphatase